jgi:hypothetical protein
MANPPVRRRRKSEWADPEALVTGMVHAYDLAEQLGQRLTQQLHRKLAKENPAVVPMPSVVDTRAKQHGKTANWVREEAQRRRARRRRMVPK